MRATLQSTLAVNLTPVGYMDRDVYIGSNGNNFRVVVTDRGRLTYPYPPVYLSEYDNSYDSMFAMPPRGNVQLPMYYLESLALDMDVSGVYGLDIDYPYPGWEWMGYTNYIDGRYYGGGMAYFTVSLRRRSDSVVLATTRFILQD